MNLSLSRTLSLLALSIVLFSCGGDDPQPATVTPSFLSVGTKYTFYINDGFFNDDSLRTVIDQQLAPDTFLVRHSSESIAVSPTQYWVLKDNDFYSSIRLRDPSMYVLECKFGKPVGTTWTVTKSGLSYTYSIDALDVAITTGDGVVNDAIKIKMHAATGQDFIQYISPTVGLLGNGSIDETASTKLIHYTIGTASTTTNHIPAITYGNFPFLAVGKYWDYTESGFLGDEVAVNLLIESKLPSKNVYKAKLTYDGAVSYSYWFEDNGLLKVYEEGETELNADPIYMNEDIATIGYGWTGITSNSVFIYKITDLGQVNDTFFGELPCMEINVTDGLFSFQSNYWNENKGNVLVSGFVSREVVDSNARKNSNRLFIPVVSF